MIMADVFKILFLVLGTLITIVGYWLLFEACVPRTVSRAKEAYENRPWRTFWVGLVVVAPLLVLGLVLANAGAAPVKLVGVTLLLLLVLTGLLGSTGFARLVGIRLNAPADEAQPWRRVLRGGSVVSVTFVLPLAGWFIVLPAVLITGVGAAVLAYRGKPRTSNAVVAAA